MYKHLQTSATVFNIHIHGFIACARIYILVATCETVYNILHKVISYWLANHVTNNCKPENFQETLKIVSCNYVAAYLIVHVEATLQRSQRISGKGSVYVWAVCMCGLVCGM